FGFAYRCCYELLRKTYQTSDLTLTFENIFDDFYIISDLYKTQADEHTKISKYVKVKEIPSDGVSRASFEVIILPFYTFSLPTNIPIGIGEGHTKQAAKKAAAGMALQKLKKIGLYSPRNVPKSGCQSDMD